MVTNNNMTGSQATGAPVGGQYSPRAHLADASPREA
jgi:hypothetical protein